jgi:AraC-like DNA-binding protein
MNTLLDAVRKYTEAHAGKDGVAATPVPGLTTVRACAPSGLVHGIQRPLVCLVLQGSKQVTFGTHSVDFHAGDSLLVTADVPTVSQVTRASLAEPYLALVLELDPAVIAELAACMAEEAGEAELPLRLERTDGDVSAVALRLMRLLDRPAAVPILHQHLVRELHYWLLAGRHGVALRRLGAVDSRYRRVAGAVALLRAQFRQTVPVERLAAVAGMSVSALHEHFRAATSLSPLQFQKQLRLIEARRLMVAEGANASSAAFAVGYESVPQFTRDYGRMFGQPPVRDTRALRLAMREGAPAAS